VYTEAHPRRNAAHAASCTYSISSNSFISYSLRTLASHLETTVSSNPFAINCFRTLCKIPGIGYPPPFPFLDSFLMRSPQSSTLAISAHCSCRFSRVTGPPRPVPIRSGASRSHLAPVTYSFRINTCKSVSKQTTLTPFRMNTYEKQGGRGVPPSHFPCLLTSLLHCPGGRASGFRANWRQSLRAPGSVGGGALAPSLSSASRC
jgi:hypothetical protein